MGPLDGLRVLELGGFIAAPYVGRLLGDYGATVISMENPKRPDMLRTAAPYKDGIPGLNRSGYHGIYNTNKYNISVNLDHPRAHEITEKLIMWCQVFVENLLPQSVSKWQLDYSSIQKIKPDIIMMSTTMHGQTGPRAKLRAVGTQAVGLAGFTHLTGWPDRDPSVPLGPYTDCIAPLFSIVSIMAAVDYWRRTGSGQHIDISQYENSLHFLSPAILDYTVNKRVAERCGNRAPYAAPHGVYPCKGDDSWCAIAVFDDNEWQSLVKVIGEPEWAKERRFATLQGRKQGEDELDRRIAEWTCTHESKRLMDLLQQVGIAAGVVKNTDDLLQDPQLQDRDHFYKVDHPEIGEYSVSPLGFTLSATPDQSKRAAPILGEHTFMVCKEMLGLSDDEYLELDNQGVFK